MRALLSAAAALAIAAPAMAQPAPLPQWQPQDFELRQQQEALRQEMIRQQNQMTTLETQMRAQQGIQDVRAQSQGLRLPPLDAAPGHAPPRIDASSLAAIPDSALADSNKKVLDAAGDRR